MRSTILSFLIYGLYILVIGSWINGCIHSYSKHNNDPDWLQNSPLVIYRGIEYFWHDDYADVNWEERIKNDAGTIFTFLNLSNENSDIDNVKMQIENFSKKIKKYPPEKLNLLKVAAKQYIRFNKTLSNEMYNYIGLILNGEDLSPSKWGIKTKMIADSLISDYDIQRNSLAIDVMDSTAITLRLKIGFGDIEEVKTIHKNLLMNSNFIIESLNETYKKIFKEKNE